MMPRKKALVITTEADTVARALHLAVDNGYELGDGDPNKLVEYAQFLLNEGVIMAVLVQHAFCKALWGEQNRVTEADSAAGQSIRFETDIPSWEYHLQQMVIAPDAIEYLRQNV